MLWSWSRTFYFFSTIHSVASTKKFREACASFLANQTGTATGLVKHGTHMDNQCLFTTNVAKPFDLAESECNRYTDTVMGKAHLIVLRTPIDSKRLCDGTGTTGTYRTAIYQPDATDTDDGFFANVNGQVVPYPTETVLQVTLYDTVPTSTTYNNLKFVCNQEGKYKDYPKTTAYQYFCQFDDPQPSMNFALKAKNMRAPSAVRFVSLSDTSLGGCTAACSKSAVCVSVAHNKNMARCELQYTYFNHTVQVPEPAYDYWWYEHETKD